MVLHLILTLKNYDIMLIIMEMWTRNHRLLDL